MPVGEEYSISTVSSASTINSTGFPVSSLGVGFGVGVGVAVGVALAATVAAGVAAVTGVADGVAEGVGVGDGFGAGVAEATGVTVGIGEDDGAGVGLGVAATVIGAVASDFGAGVDEGIVTGAVVDTGADVKGSDVSVVAEVSASLTGVAPSIVCATSLLGTSASFEYLSIIFLVKKIRPTKIALKTVIMMVLFVLFSCSDCKPSALFVGGGVVFLIGVGATVAATAFSVSPALIAEASILPSSEGRM